MAEHLDGQPFPCQDHLEWRFSVPMDEGMHLRVLREIVNVTTDYKCGIYMRNMHRDRGWLFAKSIMGLMLLEASRGMELLVHVCKDSDDAEEAMAAFQDLVERGFESPEK